MADKRKNVRKPFTLDNLRLSMCTAIRELETIYMDQGKEPDLRIRAINSLASLANSYARITESSDLEQRVTQIEKGQMRKVS